MIKNKLVGLLIMLTSLTFGSCEENDKVENPKLNYESYIFEKSGGSIDLFSKKGYQLQFSFRTIDGQNDAEPTITYCDDMTLLTMEGNWYKVKYDKDKNLYTIEVKENTTGYKRILPIMIMCCDWGGGYKKFTQK